MSELHTFSVAQLAAGLKIKTLAVPNLPNIFLIGLPSMIKPSTALSRSPEQALAQAAAADKLLAEGKGADLTGVPLAHKDPFLYPRRFNHLWLKMLENFVAPYTPPSLKTAKIQA